MKKITQKRGRYTEATFPAYRYLPGKTPRPVREPKGYNYRTPIEAEPLDTDQWESCQPYLLAIDLFNHRYYWEAHEELEPLWRATGRRTKSGIFLQGLIQVAAALLKSSMDERGPASRLAAHGCAKLRTIGAVHLGIHGPDLARAIEVALDEPATGPVTIQLEGLEYFESGN